MNKTEEALVILAEECAEVIQECSKALRFGLDSEHEGETVRERLEKELGDVQCMIDILFADDVVSFEKMNEQAERKYEKLRKWSNLFK